MRSGYRHEAAALWRERLAWQTAFASPEERDREDWRVEPRLELVEELSKLYESWAERCQVLPWDEFRRL